MIREISVFGVYFPPLLLYAAVAGILWQCLRVVLERLGFYRLVWHPALFNVSAYVAAFAAVAACFMQGA